MHQIHEQIRVMNKSLHLYLLNFHLQYGNVGKLEQLQRQLY